MNFLDSIVSVLTIATLVSSGYNKSVSFQLNVKDNKVDGFQASYKIRFLIRRSGSLIVALLLKNVVNAVCLTIKPYS